MTTALPGNLQRDRFTSASPILLLVGALAVTGCGSDGAVKAGTTADAGNEGNPKTDASTSADSGSHADATPVDAGPGPLSITLDDGALAGDIVGGSRLFLKIPFAKPPIGDLRWKAPVKNDPWTGTRHETAFTQSCAQNASSQGAASLNEDCLYLNVWAPARNVTHAPVMVWIHGGGNFAGSAGDSVPVATPTQLWYDGQFFAARHGVVVVSVNYRLGPLGFFAHPSLAGEGSPLGNQGLLDQRRALEWVRDNVEKFGGDPGNVTIFGESAGSADVCYHVVSPGSAGLFHRAVSESGGCTVALGGGKDRTAAAVATGMAAFTKALGCDAASDPLACLRGKPIADIMTNAQQPDLTSGVVTNPPWSFGVVVDGTGGFLPDQPRALFDAGTVAKVPYILGSNTDEGTLFLLGAPAIGSAAAYTAALQARFATNAAAIEAEYPVSKFNGDYNAALARVIGDSGLVCGTHDTARRAAKAGLSVYMYDFNIPWAILPTLLHASHASEISHVFGDPVKAAGATQADTDASQAVSDAMNAFWARFASTGNPNGSPSPATWPKFAPDASDHDQRLQLDPGFELLADFRKDECTFWRGLYDAAR